MGKRNGGRMKYFVVERQTAEALSTAVTERLAQGWCVTGTLVVTGEPGYRLYCQAMLKG